MILLHASLYQQRHKSIVPNKAGIWIVAITTTAFTITTHIVIVIHCLPTSHLSRTAAFIFVICMRSGTIRWDSWKAIIITITWAASGRSNKHLPCFVTKRITA